MLYIIVSIARWLMNRIYFQINLTKNRQNWTMPTQHLVHAHTIAPLVVRGVVRAEQERPSQPRGSIIGIQHHMVGIVLVLLYYEKE
jgi:hypothetical protein